MLAVADDLSGAVEAASVLGARRVVLGPRDAHDGVVDLDSRELAPEEAARRVRALDGRIAFKKIDSLLRGNVKAEIEALTGDVIVAPALPVEGRTVRGGVLHVHGVPHPSHGLTLHDAETDEDLDAIVAAAPPGAIARRLGRARGGARPPPRSHAAAAAAREGAPAAARGRDAGRRRAARAARAAAERGGDPRQRRPDRRVRRRRAAATTSCSPAARPPAARSTRSASPSSSRSRRSTTAPSSAARPTAAA